MLSLRARSHHLASCSYSSASSRIRAASLAHLVAPTRRHAPPPRASPASDDLPPTGFEFTQDAYDQWVQECRDLSMEEYAQFKSNLFSRTRRAGGLLAGYFALAVSPLAAACVLFGLSGSLLYLTLLCRDIDNVQGTDRVPMVEAMRMENPLQRKVAKVLYALPQALKPRLLVFVGLAAAAAYYNSIVGDGGASGGGGGAGGLEGWPPLTLLEQASIAAGFVFSYKAALVQELYEALRPRYNPRKAPPTLVQVEDLTENIELNDPRIKRIKM